MNDYDVQTNNFEEAYITLINYILTEGFIKEGRNGNTLSVFGAQITVDSLINNEFPLLLGRKMHYQGVFGEMAAFLRGPERLEQFKEFGCNYWDKWADEHGNLYLDYGNAWIADNQLQDVIDNIIRVPNSRRHLVTGWRHDNILNLSLPCCHYAYQWQVEGDYLNMIWIQRSVDTLIGLPSDIILAAIFNIVVARLTGYRPGKLVFQLGDVHIYEEHVFQALQYIKQYKDLRELPIIKYPTYYVTKEWQRYDDFKPEDIVIEGYNPQPSIKFILKD